jgi:ABC-type nitrate/sulfonate/bicarbonate transport system substrate-binding protein
VAAQERVGGCAAVSAELQPNHPEKILMVRREFAEKHSQEHLALVAALLEACEFCDAPENRERLVTVLAQPEYVGVSAEALRRGFEGRFDFGTGNARAVQDFTVFHRHDANEPSGEKAAWVLQLIRAGGLCPEPSALNFALGRSVFRADLFEKAVRLRGSTNTLHEKKSNSENTLAFVV